METKKRLRIAAGALLLFCLLFVAQHVLSATADLPAVIPFTPEGELIKAPPRAAEFLVLDKITARKKRITINTGDTASFGTLFVRLRYCEASLPTDTIPEAKALLEVYEKPPGGDGGLQRIFSGWMFASSPSISGMEHPVYDIWPISCKERKPLK